MQIYRTLTLSGLILAFLLYPVVPVAGQDFVFEQRDAPFEVIDEGGRILQLPFLGGFNVPRPQLVDIDGDGDKDLFVQELSDQFIFFEHVPGSSGFPFVKRSNAYQGLSIGEWFRFVDLDQDGDQDLLSEEPFSYIRVYENTGTAFEASFTLAQDSLKDETGLPLFADRQNILNMIDINANGRLDLFIGRLDGTVFHYEQVEQGVAIEDMAFRLQSERFQDISVVGEQTGKLEDRHGANTLFFHDIDQDGDQDLFWGDFFESGLLYFENSGTPQIPLFTTDPIQFPLNQPFMTNGYNAPAVGDVNGDGLEDMIVGVLGGAFSAFGVATNNLLLLQQEVNGDFSLIRSQFFLNLDVGSDSYPVLFDVDNDGDTDLLIGNSIDPEDTNAGSVRFYENQGSSTQPMLVDQGKLDLEPFFAIVPALGDLNNDGAVDMITGSFQGEMTLYWGDPDNSALVFGERILQYLDIPTGSSSTPFLADMDEDEDLDLLVGQSSGVINYFENIGTPFEPQFVLTSSSFGGIDVGRRSAPLAADVDNDGDLDLLIGSDFDGIQAYENVGTAQSGEFSSVQWLTLDSQRRMVPAWGDLNGDAKSELMVGLLNGGVQYFENRSIGLSSNDEAVGSGVSIALYPNPTRGAIQLRISGVPFQHVTASIYTINGRSLGPSYQQVSLEGIITMQWDLSAYASGAYLVRVMMDNTMWQQIIIKID